MPVTCIASYSFHVGVSEDISYATTVFLNLGAVSAKFLPGLVADKYGRFNGVMCAFLTLILWLSLDLVAPDNSGMVTGYAVLFGFWSGAAIILAPISISHVCKMQDYGEKVGIMWTMAGMGVGSTYMNH